MASNDESQEDAPTTDIQDVNFRSENGSNSMTGYELAAIFDFLDHHYSEMLGHNKGTEYAKDKS